MEFIKDITLIIDEQRGGDEERLQRILRAFHPVRRGSCYRVKGTFKELEQLVNTLPGHHSVAARQGRAAQPTCLIPANTLVLEYVKSKCGEKVKRIQGERSVIDFRAEESDPQGSVQVTFSAQRDSPSSADRVHVDFVKQRFLTFYQRTASDLQQTSVCLAPHTPEELQRSFPRLLFKPADNNYTTVCGPFAHVHKLEEFLSPTSQSSGKGPVNKVPASRQSHKSPKHSEPPENEPCPICMELVPPQRKKTLQCKHSFCKDCLKRAFGYKPVCPVCGEVYGTLKGTQPDGGTMDIQRTSLSLPGYDHHPTIVIHYHIPSGIQKEEHPNPGQPFQGVSRTAYLPDSSEGRKVLELLRKAFNQRLIFTIGRSSTSGRNNMVTWNDIHHKTSMHGGPTSYGYPDPDYLNRVQEELKAKGIK
ncbi:uncharacterized protein si:dkey-3h3.3 [Fundulus heteroclitus]|uniref:uncharacterized protein si:dkey-3h3.3 n=1 Tax=Fundulus heteroclitus TaxID=8078 RepID=UPI00165AD25A|nr:uncharacterized protein si:dkey-3h3.3 [Fundulus heteroclitus]